jgi:hypothetical protein
MAWGSVDWVHWRRTPEAALPTSYVSCHAFLSELNAKCAHDVLWTLKTRLVGIITWLGLFLNSVCIFDIYRMAMLFYLPSSVVIKIERCLEQCLVHKYVLLLPSSPKDCQEVLSPLVSSSLTVATNSLCGFEQTTLFSKDTSSYSIF